MKSILMLVVVLMMTTGCTRYHVTKENPDGSSTTVSVWSSRNFEQPDMTYTRTGADATFDFKAAKVDNSAAAVNLLAPLIQGLLAGQIVVAPEED